MRKNMRIAIDMQGAQTGSRLRGIGRYTQSLVRAMVRNRGGHEIILVLNGAFQDTVDSIRAEYAELLPVENIRVWHSPGPTSWRDPKCRQRLDVAEKIREAFIAAIDPDVILLTTLFEGLDDASVISVSTFDKGRPVASILYDLFPLTHPEKETDTPVFRAWYARKLNYLSKCRLLLSISDYSKREALEHLSFLPDDIVNISGAIDSSFKRISYSEQEQSRFKSKFHITRPFAMYAGGADHRKNLNRLIKAYALLPNRLSQEHHLVIVGDMPQSHINELVTTAKNSGLSEKDMLVTGYVQNDELVQFYNSTRLFVFPSLLEGLGLPPLEAMACGVPVISSDAASLPEVVGRRDAMFSPFSIKSISDKMAEALTDNQFRKNLIESGLERIKQFSWDDTAKKALSALERFAPPAISSYRAPLPVSTVPTALFHKRKIKILVLKLDHMGDFILSLPAISKLRARYPDAKLDVVVGSWNEAIAKSLGIFNRIYHLDWIKRDMSDRSGKDLEEVKQFQSKLNRYDFAIDLRRQRDTRFILSGIRADIKIGYESFDKDVDGGLDIVLPSYTDIQFSSTPMNKKHIAQQMIALVDALPGDTNDFLSLPEFPGKKKPVPGTVGVFPTAGSALREWGPSNFSKLIELLENADDARKIRVFFANDRERKAFNIKAGGKIELYTNLSFQELVGKLSGCSACVANNSGGAHLASYLGVPTVGIYSGQETIAEWAPPFGEALVLHRNAFCCPCHWHEKAACQNGFFCLEDISPEAVFPTIMGMLGNTQGKEHPSGFRSRREPGLTEDLVDDLIVAIGNSGAATDDALLPISKCIAETFSLDTIHRRLFVDVSVLVIEDAGTGIQRVVKNVLANIHRLVPDGWQILPVYMESGQRTFKTASAFLRRHFGHTWPGCGENDEIISYDRGDVFFGLDLNLGRILDYKEIMRNMRHNGVRTVFMVYDLLPVTLPQHFDPELAKHFAYWLKEVAESDAAICISQDVANNLAKWIAKHAPDRRGKIRVSHAHLGADFKRGGDSYKPSQEAQKILEQIRSQPSFLMVGTLEPRKGHKQVVDAFDILWKSGENVNLVLVGKKGWKIDELEERIRAHPQRDKKLFRLENIGDEYLDQIYSAAACLIAASEGEGFGLFLIEAAHHKIPIIARDIPVFREIAGKHAFYFDGKSPETLAKAVRKWLALFKRKAHPSSEHMPWMTWRESSAKIIDLLLATKDEGEGRRK